MNFIFSVGINLFDFLILYKFMNTFMGNLRFSKKSSIFFLLFLSLVHAAINILSIPVLNITSIILFTILFSSLYKSSWVNRIFICLIYIGIGLLTEPLGFLTLNLALIDTYPESSIYNFSVILIEIFRFIFVMIICHYKSNDYRNLPQNIMYRLIIIPIITIIGCCGLAHFAIESTNVSDIVLALFLCLLLLFINYFMYFLFEKLNLFMKEQNDNELLVHEMLLKEEYYKEISKNNDIIRGIKHDLQNELIGILDLVERNPDECKQLISDILHDLNNVDYSRFCNNNIVNAILKNKYQISCSNNITMTAKVNVPVALSIPTKELCILLGNLLDNAIEACQRNSSESIISVNINFINNCLYISIKNSKNPDEIFTAKTYKKDSINHGFGIKSIQKIVDKYNGTLQLKDNHDYFQSDVVLYGIESIV